jgi:hypothetical protein
MEQLLKRAWVVVAAWTRPGKRGNEDEYPTTVYLDIIFVNSYFVFNDCAGLNGADFS